MVIGANKLKSNTVNFGSKWQDKTPDNRLPTPIDNWRKENIQ